MPISRDPRMDRRRRVLMDSGQDELLAGGNTRSKRSDATQTAEKDGNSQRRNPGYSQDVRKACSQRLVQLIPVRRRSYLATILVSLLIPGLLLLAHYMINVSGSLRWWGHPLAISLDASHRNSIASWLSSQLWLLCLGATILTFQLRRHKLDDYNGDYRLWFWLVITCLAASIDATTRISDLFGMALDRWCQLNLGWSGQAVVQATLAVMIGMLGLRLCTELKAVPTSLIFWLTGLVCWAASAALAQDELMLNMSEQVRIWLKVTLWLGGLTAVWLSALTYLRHVYIEAQRRFLLRGRLATSLGVPLAQRIRGSMPHMPKLGKFRRGSDVQEQNAREQQEHVESGSTRRGWSMPFRRRASTEDVAPGANEIRPRPNQIPRQTRREQPRLEEPKDASENSSKSNVEVVDRQPSRGLGAFLRRPASTEIRPETSKVERAKPKTSVLGNWLRKPKDSDDAEEYRKVDSVARTAAPSRSDTAGEEAESARSGRRWIPKLRVPKLPKVSLPKLSRSTARSEDKPAKPKAAKPTQSQPKSGGFFSKFKLPTLRLPPPSSYDNDAAGSSSSGKPPAPASSIRSVAPTQSLPGTSSNGAFDDAARPLSKAERKRLRREQQDRAA